MRHPTLQRAPLKAVIFDFDGTLAVSTLDYALMRQKAREAVREVLPDGFSYTPEQQGHVPAMEELTALCGAVGVFGDAAVRRVRAAAMDAIARVELEAAGRSSLFPFVRPMLRTLGAQGIRCGIITRNCRASIQTVFPDHEELCGCVLTRDDVEKVKPDPAHLLAALQALDCAPKEALMVGDHPMDIQVGRKAGTRTAGVASAESPFADLVKEKPTWLARDAGELVRWLGLMDTQA